MTSYNRGRNLSRRGLSHKVVCARHAITSLLHRKLVNGLVYCSSYNFYRFVVKLYTRGIRYRRTRTCWICMVCIGRGSIFATILHAKLFASAWVRSFVRIVLARLTSPWFLYWLFASNSSPCFCVALFLTSLERLIYVVVIAIDSETERWEIRGYTFLSGRESSSLQGCD